MNYAYPRRRCKPEESFLITALTGLTTAPLFLLGGGFWVSLVFLFLKLTENIGWSWAWVFSPLWIPLALFVGFFLALSVTLGIKEIKSK